MPATRPRASFEPISPDFDLSKVVESNANFHYVDRISCDMIDHQGLAAFEKLVLLHVIVGGKPLVIDGYEERLDPWTFTPKWLRDNVGEKVENARQLHSKEYLPLTMGHYLTNMGKLTNQFYEKPGSYRDKNRQRVYLKDIDCPAVWVDKLKEQIPSSLFYMNDSTGDVGGLGAVPDPNSTVPNRRLGRGIAKSGDLMSCLPPDMRADNLMCYIGHEGTYTPAHREMCASLGQNIMVEASGTVSDDGKPEKPGSSIWFMTESADRHVVSEYWLSVLGHDIEVEDHFAQVVAWKKAPFKVYVVEQKPGDFILIPPLAPHQVWNRGTRTMKVAWNRTTVETLEMAINEALPRSRIVCRDEQYKNKAMIYYALQKYSGQLASAQQQAARLPTEAAQSMLYSGKIKQLQKDFKRLFALFKQVLLSEMFNPEDRDNPRSVEYLPFDSNVTCAYCRGNIFNRFLSCSACKDMLGHNADDGEGDPYDVCMECYAMGRSCACISNLKWVEQFRWKELASKYETWRKLIIDLDGGMTEKTPLTLVEERKRHSKKTLAEVCRDQLKRRPFKDIRKSEEERKDHDEDEDEEIVVGDDGTVKSIRKKPSKAWLKSTRPCHVCCKRHPVWKMALCTTCDRGWCYGALFRGWDKMPIEIMEDPDWNCPHCLEICFAGACRREGKMVPYEPKGTLLGHDTKKVADARSVEALVDFSVSNLTWLKDDDAVNRTESSRIKRAQHEAAQADALDPELEDEDENGIDQSRVDYEYAPGEISQIDPALGVGRDEEAAMMHHLQQANVNAPPAAVMTRSGAPDGYAAVSAAGYVSPGAEGRMDDDEYGYSGHARATSVEPIDGEGMLRPFKRARNDDEDEGEDINMQKHPKAKKQRLTGAGFKSSDLADGTVSSRAKTEAQRQFEKENQRKALEKAKLEGRFIMLQAALRGKKRIVKLTISPHRLEEVVARFQDEAGEQDAAHIIDSNEPQPEEDENAEDDILKSDLAPKKTRDSKQYLQRREREGFIITSKTKKALVPVERDDSYSARHRERGPDGKRIDTKVAPKRRGPRNVRPVEYEEVDIGSDEEGEASGIFMSGGLQQNKRRGLPSYLRERDEEDEEEYPDQLPESFKDRPPPKPSQSNKVRTGSRPAGKRPSMRPSSNIADTDAMAVDEDGDDDDANEEAAIDAAINGDFMNGNSSTVPQQRRAGLSQADKAAQRRQHEIEEENRLAKLQALQAMDMLDDDENAGGSNNVNTAQVISSGEESSDDDGPDSVPARGVRA